MLRKNLLLIPLVISSGTVYAGSEEGVLKALSKFCVPYSDENEKGRVYNTAVCSSVFEGIYNPNKSGEKCDCYEGSAATAKFLKYDSNVNQRKCRPQCNQGFGAKKTTNGDCPSGYFKSRIDRPDSGSGSFTFNCEICKAGEYSNNGFECIACAPGHYSDKDGLSTCTICPAGTYSETAGGATKCIPCRAGQYCPAGSSVPSMCPNGQYSPDTKVCKSCPEGYKCPGGTLIKCPAGTYQGAKGQTSCDDCTTGHYCPEGATKETTCPKGQYAAAKSGSCSACNSGTTTKTSSNDCGTIYYDVTSYCQKDNCFPGNATDCAVSETTSKNITCEDCAFNSYVGDASPSGGTLSAGSYKVIVAGAKGGNAGQTGKWCDWCPRYSGGNGEVKRSDYFHVPLGGASYTATIGAIGSNGGDAKALHAGGNGKSGGSSSFNISGIVSISAIGGGGGISSGVTGCAASCNGREGTRNGPNSGAGYVRIYRFDPSYIGCSYWDAK